MFIYEQHFTETPYENGQINSKLKHLNFKYYFIKKSF